MWTILGTIFLAPIAFVGGVILVMLLIVTLGALFKNKT